MPNTKLPKKRRAVAPLFWIPTELEALQRFDPPSRSPQESPIFAGRYTLLPPNPIVVADSVEPDLDPGSCSVDSATKLERRMAARYRLKAFHPLLSIVEAARWGWSAVANASQDSNDRTVDRDLMLKLGKQLFPKLEKFRLFADVAREASNRLGGLSLSPDFAGSWEAQDRSDRRTLSRKLRRLTERLSIEFSPSMVDPLRLIEDSPHLLNHVLQHGNLSEARSLLAAVHQTITAFSQSASCAYCFRHAIPGELRCPVHSSGAYAESLRSNLTWLPREEGRPAERWTSHETFTELPKAIYANVALQKPQTISTGLAQMLEEMVYCPRVEQILALKPFHIITSADLLARLKARLDPLHRASYEWVSRVLEAERYIEHLETPASEHVSTSRSARKQTRISKATEFARTTGEKDKERIGQHVGVTRQAIERWIREGAAEALKALLT